MEWKTWDIVTTIRNHQSIKDTWALFHGGLKGRQSFFVLLPLSSTTLHPDEEFDKLFAIDVIGFCAQLSVMVTDNSTYKEVLSQHDSAAQSILNLLQAVFNIFFVHHQLSLSCCSVWNSLSIRRISLDM
jgi:hypothetical protein